MILVPIAVCGAALQDVAVRGAILATILASGRQDDWRSVMGLLHDVGGDGLIRAHREPTHLMR